MAQWPPNARECILPSGRTKYLNEEQRNVHIWNSRPVDGGRNRPVQFKLLASLWVDQGHRRLPTKNLYRWLSFMTSTRMEPSQVMIDFGYEDSKDFRLLNVADPRVNGLPRPENYHSFTPMRSTATQDDYVGEGHYIIVGVTRNEKGEEKSLVPIEPAAHIPVIEKRDVSRTGTNTAARRRDITRLEARRRDLGCRFSTEFTFEHHKPLYGWYNIPQQPAMNHIDIPQNAIVLRADVHSQYDAYQFGLEPRVVQGTTSGKLEYSVPEVRIFERDGAFSLDRSEKLFMKPPAVPGTTDVNHMFLLQHLMTGILWHVAGNGMNSMTDAIIPHTMRGTITGHDAA